MKSHSSGKICVEKLYFVIGVGFLRELLGHWICDTLFKTVLEFLKVALNKIVQKIIWE